MFKKCKETILYLFFGVATTAINWLSYSLIMLLICNNINIANITAWLISVIFAFFVNKFFVFKKKNNGRAFREFIMFFSTRLFSGVLEVILLPTLIWLGINGVLYDIEGFAAKILTTTFVFIVNYICTKYLIFKGGKKDE